MRPALARSPRDVTAAGTELGRLSALLGARWRRLAPRLARDPYLAYTAALFPIAGVVLLAGRHFSELAALAGLSLIFIGAQAWLSGVPGRLRPLGDVGWSLIRLSLALLYVAAVIELSGGAAGPMAALFLPLIVASAALGTLQAVATGAAASLIYLVPELSTMGTTSELALRGITLAGISVLLAIGTRRLVVVLERTSRRLRAAMIAERRRSRQIGGMEAVSRLLMAGGPTDEVLDRALGVLHQRFGYGHVTIYRAEGERLVLSAQRGYDNPIASFDGSVGVVGRAMRSHRLQFVLDVQRDPDYIGIFDEVVSEICAPLLVDGQFLGVLNVESRDRLERTDRDVVASLADRLATVVALGHDRQALAERGAVLRRLHEFTQAVSATLVVDRLAAELVNGAQRVVPADVVALTILDRQTGRYRVRAATDLEATLVGAEVRLGEGLAGRAIRDRTQVFDDHPDRDRYPAWFEPPDGDWSPVLGAGVPLIRDGAVVGAISLVRRDLARPFQPIEREALELLAGHAALVISNAFLHDDLEELAITDPLTGLYNRRYFDETLDRIIATWHRSEPPVRRDISAILFDLDNFGEFNKQHGHQVGDMVLRSFAALLRERFRAADLVARLGGEEFMVVLEGADRAAAERLADEVRTRLSSRDLANEDGVRLLVTVSAGCAQLGEPRASREELVRAADVALFMAKRAGRDRVVSA